MSTSDLLLLLLLLFSKHFVADFLLQARYQWSNKGRYGHPGGLLHAGIHALGTLLALLWLAPAQALALTLLDALVHYHVDWAKSQINQRTGWQTGQPQYWWLFGLDQFVHALTYLLIAWLVLQG